MITLPYQQVGREVAALLDAIAISEIGHAMLNDPMSDNGYRVIVGSNPNHLLIFQSYARHPMVLNVALNSTAAGRYQFIRSTWLGLVGRLGLADFSPANQDRGAIELIRQRGAMEPLLAGDVEQAITLCGAEWASLPGSQAGQHPVSMADAIYAYTNALGSYPSLPA